jgi:hypothetical protein
MTMREGSNEWQCINCLKHITFEERKEMTTIWMPRLLPEGVSLMKWRTFSSCSVDSLQFLLMCHLNMIADERAILRRNVWRVLLLSRLIRNVYWTWWGTTTCLWLCSCVTLASIRDIFQDDDHLLASSPLGSVFCFTSVSLGKRAELIALLESPQWS